MEEKKNSNVVGIVIVVIIGLIFVGTTTFFLLKDSKSTSNQIDNSSQQGGGNDSQNVVLGDGENSENITGFHNDSSPEENNTEPEVIPEGILDISVTSLNLTKKNCVKTGPNNITICDIDIVGSFKNVGNVAIGNIFSVHIFDTTAGFSLIDSVSFDSLGIGEGKTVSVTYENLTNGKYFILLRADGSNLLKESNEYNNDLTKILKI